MVIFQPQCRQGLKLPKVEAVGGKKMEEDHKVIDLPIYAFCLQYIYISS